MNDHSAAADAASGAGPNDASRRLASLAAEAWDGQMAAHPIFATALGERRFDDRLRPNAPGALEADGERLAARLQATAAIDPSALEAADRVTRAALIDFLGSELDVVESGVEAWSVDPLDGPQVTFLNVSSFQTVRNPDDAQAMVARWREMGPWIDRLVQTSRAALGRGIRPPQALVRSVVAELDDLLARPVADWPLSSPIAALPDDWPETDR